VNILALDPATHMGWALSNGISGVWDFSIRRDESGGMRLIRLQSKLRELNNDNGIDLVVFEAARHAGPGMQGALVVQSELQAVIKLWCESEGIDYRGYSPGEIKKFATGKGNASKDTMREKAEECWPKKKFTGGDEIDAWWLLLLSMCEMREDTSTLQKMYAGC